MRGFFSAIVVFLLIIFALPLCYADMYRYTDDSGSVCITNSLESVPKKYRKAMTVVKEESASPKKLLPEVQKRTTDPLPQAGAHQSAIQEETSLQPVDNRPKYIRTALVVAAVVASFFLLGWIGRAIGAPRTGTLLFLLFTLVGGVYLYRLYVKELHTVFSSLRKDAINIKKNVETREQKTDQIMKKATESE